MPITREEFTEEVSNQLIYMGRMMLDERCHYISVRCFGEALLENVDAFEYETGDSLPELRSDIVNMLMEVE